MENNINGKEVNKKFIEAIKRRRKKLFEDAKPYITTSNATDVIEKVGEERGEEKYIKKEDREEFDILMTLLSYIEYKEEPKENVYEFKGLEYKAGKRTNKATIFVTKENAMKISRLANDYEEKLKRSNNADDMKMSIKFPVELLMLKYQGQNMPGLDYTAPDAKLASQTEDEYDAQLKQYYAGHGVDTKADATSHYREAYPHEKINYRKDPAEITNVVQNGYYTERAAEIAANAMGAEHGDPGMEPDEEQPVVGTDDTLGRKIGDRLREFKHLLKSDTLPNKLGKLAVFAGLGYTAVSCLIANPGVTLLVAAGATVAVGGAALIFPKVKKGLNAIKKKIKEWFTRPELTQPPQGGNGGNGGNNGGNNDGATTPPTGGNGGATTPPTGGNAGNGGNTNPDPDQTLTVEEINDRIEELQNELATLNTEKERLEGEINGLPDGQEKLDKIAELKKVLSKIKVRTLEVASLLHQHDVDHSTGGPRL